MKTPSFCTVSVRACLLVLASMLDFSPPGRAEWITLQIPLGLSGNTFRLWEMVHSGTAGSTLFAGGDYSGLEAGSYLQTSVTPMQFIGGSFDAAGNWVPDSNSYFMVVAERQGTGSYWLEDISVSRFSPPNQPGLISAQWHEPNPSAPMRYFALPESRFGHVFSLQYWDSNLTTYLLTTGNVRGEFLLNGTFSSYGFFEGWAPELLPPLQNPPIPPYEGWIIDHTEGLALYVDGTGIPLDPFVSTSWQPFTGPTPTYPVTFVVSGSHGPESFTLNMVNGSQMSTTSALDPASYLWVVSASVGRGMEFWLERDDGRTTSHYWMIDSALSEDVSSLFPDPTPDVQTLLFRVRTDTHNPADFHVEQPGAAPAPFVVTGNAMLESWDDLGNYSSLNYATCVVDVDVKRSWTVHEGAAAIGQEADIFDGWLPAAHSAPPTGTVQFYIPIVRQADTIRIQGTGDNWTLTDQSDIQHFSMNDPWTGSQVTWDVFRAAAPVGSTFESPSLVDENYADTKALSAVTDSMAASRWFPQSTLLLKISGTRWGHNLRVRSIMGEFPVTQHQIQGDWSIDAVSGYAQFNNYGYFDATAPVFLRATGTANPLVPWILVDITRLDGQGQPQVLSAEAGQPTNFVNATDSTDTDGDSLADWYERVIGTNPNNPDTDGDTLWDGVDSNPRTISAGTPGSTLKVYTQLR